MEVKKHGGYRPGAGRKAKVKEDETREAFNEALRRLYNTEDDLESKVAFILDLIKTQRGQLFIAEHVFGKAPQVIESENPLFQIPIVSFGNKS